jgi:pyruvate,orthophosphate dikinase
MIDSDAPVHTKELLEWADDERTLGVWANADSPDMVEKARSFGAEGIGLLRTERQFDTPESLAAIRAFAIADTDEERRAALDVLFEVQKEDFVQIFRSLNGIPAIVRLMDLPLHEFLSEEFANSNARARKRRNDLSEVNPMMGHRGVRLGLTYPELYRMQVDAIRAALEVAPADVRIMVPQVISPRELVEVKKHIDGQGIKVGVMVETARACVCAPELAKEAAFFSFGTNDLTQAVLSFSREDAEKKFMNDYLERGILPHNPFVTLDEGGVVPMMQMAVKGARSVDPDFSIGVCGEHGGDPASVKIAHRIGVTYISCSPFRIPGARLAAAQAALEEQRAKAPTKERALSPV